MTNLPLSKAGVYLGLILVVGLLGSGLLANSILPLVSTPFQATVTVKNSATMQPIQGATVNCYLALSGMIADSGMTNQAGVIALWGYFETPMIFEASASGYTTNSVSTTIYATGSKTVTVLLTSGGGPGGDGYIDVYCLSNDDRRVNNVLVFSSLGSVLTDERGYAKVLITSGSNTISFSNTYGPTVKASLVWESLSFVTYQRTISPASGSSWVAYVQQGGLTQGTPPYEQQIDVWQWLSASMIPGVPNWALVFATLILLIIRR